MKLKDRPTNLLFLQGFFNSLRTELADYPNITISTICPGPVVSSIVHNAFTEQLDKVPHQKKQKGSLSQY